MSAGTLGVCVVGDCTRPSLNNARCELHKLRRDQALPDYAETVHACPIPGTGAATVPCCGKTPFELPRTDRMTSDPKLVTCGADRAGPFSIGSDVWPGISKLVEESGELGQVIGKLLATGGHEKHWDGSDLRERMRAELADLRAAIDFVAVVNELDLTARHAYKLRLFHTWQDRQ